jgi:hypothetical protein
MLKEALENDNPENQTIGNMSATIQGYQVSVQMRKWS